MLRWPLSAAVAAANTRIFLGVSRLPPVHSFYNMAEIDLNKKTHVFVFSVDVLYLVGYLRCAVIGLYGCRRITPFNTYAGFTLLVVPVTKCSQCFQGDTCKPIIKSSKDVHWKIIVDFFLLFFRRKIIAIYGWRSIVEQMKRKIVGIVGVNAVLFAKTMECLFMYFLPHMRKVVAVAVGKRACRV